MSPIEFPLEKALLVSELTNYVTSTKVLQPTFQLRQWSIGRWPSVFLAQSGILATQGLGKRFLRCGVSQLTLSSDGTVVYTSE